MVDKSSVIVELSKLNLKDKPSRSGFNFIKILIFLNIIFIFIIVFLITYYIILTFLSRCPSSGFDVIKDCLIP